MSSKGEDALLVVQKTGWGKSAVYFIATKLLREQGAGPAILISPLLSLMRNQIAAAERMGGVNIEHRTSNIELRREEEDEDAIHDGPVPLVDDMVDSGWTLTVAAYLLKTHGSGPVYPLALASTKPAE